MPQFKLHLDADASSKALHSALLKRGHNVTRTPNAWISGDATDQLQLIGATQQGRCIFTHNVKDFAVLAIQFPQHGGILLASQKDSTLPQLIRALDNVLTKTQPEDWIGQANWLSQWR